MAKNKLAKFAENERLENVIQPRHEEIFRKDYFLKGVWNKQFFRNNHPLTLEVGCGKGEYTVGLGQIFPERNFIGMDIKGARLWHGAKYAAGHQIENVAFLRMYAEMLDSVFGKGEVSEIWITFPDPQMAKARKRLTGSRFLMLYKKFLKEDGIIHLKTDSPFLFRYTEALIRENNLKYFTITDDLYDGNHANDILSIQTFYEKQWLLRGKKIKYIRFSLEGKDFIKEPDIELEKDDYHSESRYMSGLKNNFEK